MTTEQDPQSIGSAVDSWSGSASVDPVAALHKIIKERILVPSMPMPVGMPIVLGPWSWLRIQIDTACRVDTWWGRNMAGLTTPVPYAARSALRGLYALANRRDRGVPALKDLMRVACRSLEGGEDLARQWAAEVEANFQGSGGRR